MERNIFLNSTSIIFIWLAIMLTVTLHFNPTALFNELSRSSNVLKTASDMIPKYVSLAPIAENELSCMAENIYYEAATQSYAGKIAVGQVVLNRVKAPGYPDSVCKVISEGSQNIHTSTCQFSWRCAPHAPINKTSEAWAQSIKAATELLTKKDAMVDITEGAVNYHADSVNPPWSHHLQRITKIDAHIFYK